MRGRPWSGWWRGGGLDDLDEYLTRFVVEPGMRATVRASTFSATLEMVREGILDVQQDRPFAPIWVKARAA